MALLRPRSQRGRFPVRTHTVLRCPMNGHQVSFCRGLCKPSPLGRGLCGRLAPHGLMSRTQLAIVRQRAGLR